MFFGTVSIIKIKKPLGLFSQGDSGSLVGQQDGGMTGLFPLTGFLGIVVNQDTLFNHVFVFLAITDNDDDLLGGQLRDELSQPVDLGLLGILIGGLGEDVALMTVSDCLAHGRHVGGEGAEATDEGVAASVAVVGIGTVEVCERSVHVEVVSHLCVLLSVSF